jgi:hypothetical protein
MKVVAVLFGGTNKEKDRRPLSDPVFSESRFVPLAETLSAVPVASAALGPVAGLPAARLVASHFTVMTQNAAVLIAGPQVVKRALGHDMTKEELGRPASAFGLRVRLIIWRKMKTTHWCKFGTSYLSCPIMLGPTLKN